MKALSAGWCGNVLVGKPRLRGFKCVMGELQKLDPWEQQAVVKSPYMVPAGDNAREQQMLGSWAVVS